jgi:hypothetical protein
MYNCLYNRNPEEWGWVRQGIANVKKEYIETEEFDLFEEYISKQF